jgi:hypothetical protein
MRTISNLLLALSQRAGNLGNTLGRYCVLSKIIEEETGWAVGFLAEPLHHLSVWLGDVSERLRTLSDKVESARIAYKYNTYNNNI